MYRKFLRLQSYEKFETYEHFKRYIQIILTLLLLKSKKNQYADFLPQPIISFWKYVTHL